MKLAAASRSWPLTVKLSVARSLRRQTKALYPQLRHPAGLTEADRASAPTIVRGRPHRSYCARAKWRAQTEHMNPGATSGAADCPRAHTGFAKRRVFA